MQDRYELGGVIASGTSSTVYEARDVVTSARVACKVVHADVDPIRIAREIAALRLFDEPGVARLIAHGLLADGRMCIVLERVDGSPFPGRAAPLPWDALAPVALGLLDTLERLHRCGIVHGDLSPGNVLVDDGGRVTLVDFGSAFVPANEALPASASVPFAAPELLVGRAISQASDVYSAGALLVYALCGTLPWDRGDLSALGRSPWDGLEGVAPALVATIRGMLSVDPGARPSLAQARDTFVRPGRGELAFVGWHTWVGRAANAVARGDRVRVAIPPGGGRRRFRREVDRRLGLPTTVEIEFVDPAEDADVRPGPLDRAAVGAMFAGPDALGCREDAAREALRRTAGWPGEIAREVRRWVAQGWATEEAGKVRVERPAIERLTAAMTGSELRRVLSLARDPGGSDFLREACALAERWSGLGRAGEALALTEAALAGIRHTGPAVAGLVRTAVLVACYAHDEGWITRARALLVPPETRDPSGSFGRLLDASRSALDPALEPLDCAPIAEEVLDAARMAMSVYHVLRRYRDDDLDLLLEQASGWAARWRTPWAEARFAGWAGQIAYRRGEFERAAELHLASADGREAPVERMAALSNAASSFLEAGDPARAELLGEQILAVAQEARHLGYWARALWIVRAARYRACRPVTLDPQLESALSSIGSDEIGGMLALTEAAVAWRALDHRTANRLARIATNRLSRSAQRWGGALAAALLMACSEPAHDRARALVEEARSCPLPSVAVQILGLVAASGARMERADRDLATRIATRVPRQRRSQRLEVLGVDEALELVRDAV